MARDSISKDGIVAILNKQRKKGVLKIVDADGDVKDACSLTIDGKGILESRKPSLLAPLFEVRHKNGRWIIIS